MNAALSARDRAKIRSMASDIAIEPINKVMFNEGRRYAVDVVETCKGLVRSAMGRASLVTKLRIASAGRPTSYAKGIGSVIEILEKMGVVP